MKVLMMSVCIRFSFVLFAAYWLSLPALLLAGEPVGNAQTVLEMEGLVSFWTFGEQAGELRKSISAGEEFPLQEVSGPIQRADDGPYSGYSAHFNGSQYLKIPYAETGKLNIAGPKAQVSMFAVVNIHDLRKSRTIAGMWSEGKGRDDDSGTRQYVLLMNMPTYGGLNQLVPHISSEGGVTHRADGSKFPWCADYAASKSKVPTDQWCTLGFTYDGKYITAYINGVLEPRELNPKADKRNDPYFLTEGLNGTNRGMNPYYHGRGIFQYDAQKHGSIKGLPSDFTVAARFAVGSMNREATIGKFGGLAVFDRALLPSEMLQLHESANIKALNQQSAQSK